MTELVVTAPPSNGAERAYVLEVVLGYWLGLDHRLVSDPRADRVTIELAGHPERITVADGLLATMLSPDGQACRAEIEGAAGRGAGQESAVTDGAGVIDEPVPVLYGPVPPVALTTNEPCDGPGAGSGEGPICEVGIDVFGPIFALLTGLEDRWISERDGHGRVPRAAGVLAQRGLEERPVVDELVEILWAALSRTWPQLPRRPLTSTTRLTQDVDRLTKFGSGSLPDLALALGSAARRGGPGEVARALSQAVGVRRGGNQRDPYFSFDRYMDLAERHGHRASFFFITRFQDADGTSLARYGMDDAGAQWLLGRAAERGHEIGIHPCYDSHRDAEAIRADVDELRRAASRAGVELGSVGGRHHYLRWDTHRSPGAWQAVGLAHDSSLGWPDGVGFRCGTSKPFPLWDHQRREPTAVIERPLIWMDVALGEMGLGYDDPATADRLLALRRTCHRYGGDYTLLVHNDQLATPGCGELVDQVLGATL